MSFKLPNYTNPAEVRVFKLSQALQLEAYLFVLHSSTLCPSD